MKVLCPAKINLFLNVLGLTDNNMHRLFLVNQTVDLYDEIDFELNKDDSIVLKSNDDIPLDEKNSVYKAASLFRETYNIKDGFIFDIKKHIPIEAGLGGESTDAAGVLLLLNKYYKLNISVEELSVLGSKIGSDVPFFIHSGFKFVTSTGTIVNEASISNPFNYYIIVKPNYGLSTKEMFHKIDSEEYKEVDIGKLPYNDFMKVVPQSILDIKDYFNSIDLTNHTLSGSGSSYYVALVDKDIELYNKIKDNYKEYKVFLVSNSDGFIVEGD